MLSKQEARDTVKPLDKVIGLVKDERIRQDKKWGWPNNGLASDNVDRKLTILAEEFGEAARAILEEDNLNLQEELVQVAAVAVAWLESIEEFGR